MKGFWWHLHVGSSMKGKDRRSWPSDLESFQILALGDPIHDFRVAFPSFPFQRRKGKQALKRLKSPISCQHFPDFRVAIRASGLNRLKSMKGNVDPVSHIKEWNQRLTDYIRIPIPLPPMDASKVIKGKWRHPWKREWIRNPKKRALERRSIIYWWRTRPRERNQKLVRIDLLSLGGALMSGLETISAILKKENHLRPRWKRLWLQTWQHR